MPFPLSEEEGEMASETRPTAASSGGRCGIHAKGGVLQEQLATRRSRAQTGVGRGTVSTLTANRSDELLCTRVLPIGSGIQSGGWDIAVGRVGQFERELLLSRRPLGPKARDDSEAFQVQPNAPVPLTAQ